MRLLFLSLTLLLTVNLPLASAQWDSDRFLFEASPASPRPKPKAKVPLAEKKKAKTTAESEHQSNLTTPEPPLLAAPNMGNERIPASVDLPKVRLGAFLGFADLTSKGDWEELKFSHNSYSLGVELVLPFGHSTEIGFHYSSTPELGPFRREEVGLDGSYKVNLFGYDFLLGPSYRQTSFWGSPLAEKLQFQQLNALGFIGHLKLPEQGNWKPALISHFYPIFISRSSAIKGSLFDLAWECHFQTQSKRALVLKIGYERLSLTNNSEAAGSMVQSQLKMLIGYQLATY